jgi:PTS system glucose-specific IIC component
LKNKLFSRIKRKLNDKNENEKNEKGVIKSPMTGNVVKIEDVPDETFAQKFLGDGVAIKPTSNIVTSPVNGVIQQIFPTKHAIGIVTDDGIEILIHIGLDTVKLNGEGFKSFIKQNDRVRIGDKLLEIDLDIIDSKAKSLISPIVITNIGDFKGVNKLSLDKVSNEDDLLKIEF